MNAYNVTGTTKTGSKLTVTVNAFDVARAVKGSILVCTINGLPMIMHVTEVKLIELAD